MCNDVEELPPIRGGSANGLSIDIRCDSQTATLSWGLFWGLFSES
jgi:hypothetical protein